MHHLPILLDHSEGVIEMLFAIMHHHDLQKMWKQVDEMLDERVAIERAEKNMRRIDIRLFEANIRREILNGGS